MPESLILNITLFISSGFVILLAGTNLVKLCDELADRTGMGEAITGAVFLGGLTTLPGITASISAAWSGSASLALSNAYGGIAAQTLFIAAADIVYQKANLEHAAASLENILSGVGLLVLLSMLFFAHSTPAITIWHMHPVSLLLPVVYVCFIYLASQSRENPMWLARITNETSTDEPEEKNESLSHKKLVKRWISLVLTGSLIVVFGWLLTKTGINISKATGISQSVMGAFLIAVITSFPELITSIFAVRQGALTLAVGGILGGNAFDTMFVAVADYFYLKGSIFEYVTAQDKGIAAMAAVMTGLILLGLLYRQRKGPAGIGFESIAVIFVSFIGSFTLFLSGG